MAKNFTSKIEEGGEFSPVANRYYLYLCLGCPFCHRAHMALNLKGLEDFIGLSVLDWYLGKDGWTFSTPEECPGTIPDPVNNLKYLKDMYIKTDPNFAGRVTVPVLFDSKTNRIVNNESADIVRIFNSSFNKFAKNPEVDLYPAALQKEVDSLNDVIGSGFNMAVYGAGFATSQEAYAKAARVVYKTMLKVEEILAKREGQFILGEKLTETDIRLFATAIRFDPVYYSLYMCNLARVADLPNFSAWLKKVYEAPGIKETVNMEHIKKAYYLNGSNEAANPNKIVPLYNGPLIPSD